MKKNVLFLGLISIILLFACNKPKFTCNIITPQNGAIIVINDKVPVQIQATDTKGTVIKVSVFCDDNLCGDIVTEPFTIFIPSKFLTLGKHTIKAIAVNSEGVEAKSSITINIIERGAGLESPNFVTFNSGTLPTGWITYTWETDNTIGYDDKYSLRSANYPSALVFAFKTMDAPGYVEFYSKGGNVDLYIDGKKAQAQSSAPAGSWTKWIYTVEKGYHEFKWETNGVYKYLDAVKFVPQKD